MRWNLHLVSEESDVLRLTGEDYVRTVSKLSSLIILLILTGSNEHE